MKGIILAGGAGTRLHPLTKVINKQLLPVYDKPLIYYPLSTLMLSKINDILIISTPTDLPKYQSLFGDGSSLGIKLSYAVQPEPEGLAQAFIIGEEFIQNDDVCLVLGDNIFFGAGLQKLLLGAVKTVEEENKAIIFGYYVDDPERYGIVEFDQQNNVKSIEEKPKNPKSNFAVVGLYFYPNKVCEIAKNVKPSERGELEITSVNEAFLNLDQLKLQVLSRGYAWLDTGTHQALSEATEFVKIMEKRTGLKIGCLEEISLNYGWLDHQSFKEEIKDMKGEYYNYLKRLLI